MGQGKMRIENLVVFLDETHALSEIIVELELNTELLRWKTKVFK